MPPLTPQRVRLSLKKRQGFITGEFCKVHERKKPFVCKFCNVRFDKKIWKSCRVLFMKEKSLLFGKFAMWDLMKNLNDKYSSVHERQKSFFVNFAMGYFMKWTLQNSIS